MSTISIIILCLTGIAILSAFLYILTREETFACITHITAAINLTLCFILLGMAIRENKREFPAKEYILTTKITHVGNQVDTTYILIPKEL